MILKNNELTHTNENSGRVDSFWAKLVSAIFSSLTIKLTSFRHFLFIDHHIYFQTGSVVTQVLKLHTILKTFYGCHSALFSPVFNLSLAVFYRETFYGHHMTLSPDVIKYFETIPIQQRKHFTPTHITFI